MNLEMAPSDKKLRSRLIKNGLMEYVSVPWERHLPRDDGESQELTMNLALWFIHTLAGNSHRVDWGYPPLLDEELTQLPCSHGNAGLEMPVPHSPITRASPEESRQQSTPSPSLSRKRARNQKGMMNPPCILHTTKVEPRDHSLLLVPQL
ncbi:hypothetical protein PG990_012712 [Apiospora arundinis]|uniref:Uncharacterized protein n=1 Tax=Apiospora arundinis TaxID=335852 RepID=A0ABR2HRA6_9PEZI